ncbi:MAG: YbhB/YbcL family Raf kinase inhibitor-like protein [bacterium]
MEQKSKINLTSIVFKNNDLIPEKYSCRGENINPPLLFSNVPQETKSLALIVDDPDAPQGDWVHWLVWNIPADTTNIEEGFLPPGAVQGLNGSDNNKYFGPCPPSGTHRYFFRLYALDIMLNLDVNSRKSDLENVMKGHILDQIFLIGLYSK